MLRKLWRSYSADESAIASFSSTVPNQSNTKPQKIQIDEIQDDQPENPYREIQLLVQHTDIVRHVLSVGDNCCITAGDDGTAVVWDVSLGRKLFVLNGHSRPITCMLLLKRPVMSIEEYFLLTAASDRQMRVWDIGTGDCVQLITEHSSYVKCLVSMRNGEMIVSAGENICLWSKNGVLLHSYSLDKETGQVNFMIAIKNDRIVVACEKQLVVYQITNEPENGGDSVLPRVVKCTKLLPHREAIECLVNISQATFASGSLDGLLVLWGAHTLSRCRHFNSKPEYQDPKKSYPYSIQHVFSIEDHFIFAAIGCGFCVYDLSGQILAQKSSAHYSKILHMTFVYNGNFLATCSEDGSIRLWSAARNTKRLDRADTRLEKAGNMGIVERFLGYRKDQFYHLRSGGPTEPRLIGECSGHSGAVLSILDFGGEGFISCGMDELVILWRDDVVQSMKRSDIAREMMIGASTSL